MKEDIQCREVIVSRIARRGLGRDLSDPLRIITQVFEKDGTLIAEHDPCPTPELNIRVFEDASPVPKPPSLAWTTKYIKHLPDCAIEQDWSEAEEAISLTPNGHRNPKFWELIDDLNNMKNTCTCGCDEALKAIIATDQ